MGLIFLSTKLICYVYQKLFFYSAVRNRNRTSETKSSFAIFQYFSSQTTSLKNTGMVLETQLDFKEYLKNFPNKVNNTTAIITMTFITSVYRSSTLLIDLRLFYLSNWKIAFEAALVITSAIKGIFRKKIYQLFGLTSLQKWR